MGNRFAKALAEDLRNSEFEKLRQETASLKAERDNALEEIKRLQFDSVFLEVENDRLQSEITALKSEVERLREGLKAISEYQIDDEEHYLSAYNNLLNMAETFLNPKQPKP